MRRCHNKHSLKIVGLVIVGLAVATVVARRRGYSGLGGNTIVRCRRGHLFSTIWIPGASLKAVRLGWFRFQYCPVGEHWTLVRPVRDQDLSEDQRREAVEHHDNRVF